MTIYVWHTGHQINETISHALHAGIPNNILKHTEWADNYINSTNKHIAVGYGILRGTGEIFHHNTANKVDYYEVDRGYINSGHFNGYYRISKNGMQANYVDVDLPSDRLSKLKFKREEWFDRKGRIIVCPPSEYIENYYAMKEGKWLQATTCFLDSIKIPYKVRTKVDLTTLDDDLNGCAGVITFNSNVAVDATIKGIPVIASQESIVKRWNNLDIDCLLHGSLLAPVGEEIDKLLRFISYNQFTLTEIMKGDAWRLLNA